MRSISQNKDDTKCIIRKFYNELLRTNMDTTTLIYDTLEGLSSAKPQQHAQIRQNLYNHLDLSFEKQLALYSSVLGPASAGRLTDLDSAVMSARKIVGLDDNWSVVQVNFEKTLPYAAFFYASICRR